MPDHSSSPQMSTLELWTQSVAAKWPPTLAFYDKKLELLHAFEAEGVLRAFRNQEREIAALLGDRDHQLELEPDGLALKLLRPDGDPDRLRQAAQKAIEAVSPPPVASVTVALQFLAPISEDYSQALSSSSLTFLGLEEKEVAPTSGPSLRDWDWAILLEGSSDRDGAIFQVEFGIVDADEIPERLSREIGQIESPGTHAPPDHWEEAELPDVALFADWTWTGDDLSDSAPYDVIMESWSHAREDAEQLLSHVLSRMADSTGYEKAETKGGRT